jgi:hypothetical protein
LKYLIKGIEMNIKKTGALILLAFLALGMAACNKQGPAEKLGEKIDNAAEEAGDTIEDATDKADSKVEKLGDKIEDATD